MFSLRTLFIVVAPAAPDAVALIYRTPLVTSGFVTFTIGFYMFGLLCIASGRSSQSRFLRQW